MAYDEALAARIRQSLAGETVVEKPMFGGLAFLLNGNMCVGVHNKNELMVRVGSDNPGVLDEPGARLFEMKGRPMAGWILVAPPGVASDAALRKWVDRGVAFARTLPPK